MNMEVAPTFFTSAADFRDWLAKNHDKAKELFVGFYKVGSGKLNMTWSEAVDQAICFGWIDGIRKSIDQESYMIRFTPRNPKSIWSAVNLKKVEELKKQRLMMPSGLAVYKLREESKSQLYSYERENAKLSEDFENLFQANQRAWQFFHSLPPSYQKTAIFWVMSARQESSRIRRLNELIKDSEAGRKIKSMDY
jgi:uncharacterized protein YdeI (YjbR/CyaY-like superfamily)